jgi:hypothetical protein
MKMARGVTVISNGQLVDELQHISVLEDRSSLLEVLQGAGRLASNPPSLGMKTRRPGSATLPEETLPYRVA